MPRPDLQSVPTLQERIDEVARSDRKFGRKLGRVMLCAAFAFPLPAALLIHKGIEQNHKAQPKVDALYARDRKLQSSLTPNETLYMLEIDAGSDSIADRAGAKTLGLNTKKILQVSSQLHTNENQIDNLKNPGDNNEIWGESLAGSGLLFAGLGLAYVIGCRERTPLEKLESDPVAA